MESDDDAEHRAEHRAPVLDPRRDRRKFLIPDDQVAKVLRAARRGVPETRIARALRINYRTWMRVREDDERVAAALAETRKMEEEELVSLLMDKARRGDTTSIIFALKGRHNYRDQGPVNGEAPRTNIVINLPDAMAPEQYLRMINVTPPGRGEPHGNDDADPVPAHRPVDPGEVEPPPRRGTRRG